MIPGETVYLHDSLEEAREQPQNSDTKVPLLHTIMYPLVPTLLLATMETKGPNE